MPTVQVLVVEDEALVRDVWLDALQAAGYTVEGVASGIEALARLSECQPDLILLDMMLPDMSGVSFLARLRATAAWQRIPVLIISALGDDFLQAIDGQIAEFPSLGVVRILTKPVQVETMVEHVRRAIGPGATSGRP